MTEAGPVREYAVICAAGRGGSFSSSETLIKESTRLLSEYVILRKQLVCQVGVCVQ